MLVVELDRHLIFAGLSAGVSDATRAVLAVLEVNFCLRWSFHSNGQTSGSCLTRVDVELACTCTSNAPYWKHFKTIYLIAVHIDR